MPSVKPVLALSTPVTANFPKDVRRDIPREIPSAVSLQTPLSATSAFREPLPSASLPSAGLPSAGMNPFTPTGGPLSACIKHEQKTPVTPPIAYMDFLRSMSLASPSATGKNPLNRTSTHGSTASNSSTSTVDSTASEQDKAGPDESAPSTAASEETDCSCKCDHANGKTAAHPPAPAMRSPPPRVAPLKTTVPMSPLTGPQYPLSAPATGPTFTGLNVPLSPINCAGSDTPRSPWSARSVRSPFDWDAALKARRFADKPVGAASGAAAAICQPPQSAGAGPGAKRAESSTGGGRTSVRHIREVVTRTVTYTPRMGPAPKGKRRKVDHETAVET